MRRADLGEKDHNNLDPSAQSVSFSDDEQPRFLRPYLDSGYGKFCIIWAVESNGLGGSPGQDFVAMLYLSGLPRGSPREPEQST